MVNYVVPGSAFFGNWSYFKDCKVSLSAVIFFRTPFIKAWTWFRERISAKKHYLLQLKTISQHCNLPQFSEQKMANISNTTTSVSYSKWDVLFPSSRVEAKKHMEKTPPRWVLNGESRWLSTPKFGGLGYGGHDKPIHGCCPIYFPAGILKV